MIFGARELRLGFVCAANLFRGNVVLRKSATVWELRDQLNKGFLRSV